MPLGRPVDHKLRHDCTAKRRDPVRRRLEPEPHDIRKFNHQRQYENEGRQHAKLADVQGELTRTIQISLPPSIRDRRAKRTEEGTAQLLSLAVHVSGNSQRSVEGRSEILVDENGDVLYSDARALTLYSLKMVLKRQ